MTRVRHPEIPVPMPPRWRHEIGQPVQEVTRREFNDAVGSRPRGLPPAPRTDPVGRLVSGEHVADASDPAIFTAPHEEPFQRESTATASGRRSPTAARAPGV